MSGVRLTVVGCGDAFGSGGRLNTCFHLAAGSRFLIDCGATALPGLKRLGLAPNDVEAIVLSHLHGDHFGGLPFFLLDAQFASRRDAPLVVAGPVGTAERVSRALEVFFPGSERTEWRFPLEIREIGPASPTEIGAAAVSAEEVLHPSGAPSLGLRIEAGGRTIAYSGDTEWTDRLAALATGADLFICECYAWTGRPPHHLDFGSLVARRGDLAAKRILLTHMNAEMLAHRHEVEGFDVAEDGMVIAV